MKTFSFCDINLEEFRDYRCVPTMSKKLNEMLGGGLRTDNLIVIQGPSGCGKTTFLQRLALDCINAGERVLYISAGEQDCRELAERFCCMIKEIDYDAYISQNTTEMKTAVLDAQKSIADKMVLMYTENPRAVLKTMNITEMEYMLEYAKHEGIKYIIFDYLGSVIADTADSQYALLTKIAGDLKNYATDNHACIITAMQTNRTLKEYLKTKQIDYTMLDESFMGDSIGPAKKGSICMTICNDKMQNTIKHINVFKNRLNGNLGDVCVYIDRPSYKWKDTELRYNGEINSVNGEEILFFGK